MFPLSFGLRGFALPIDTQLCLTGSASLAAHMLGRLNPVGSRAESDCQPAGSRSAATAASSAGQNPTEPLPRATPQQLAQWDRLRAYARDPNFVIDDQILKRYAGVANPRRLANDELVVIMMASAMRADLARVMRETWLRAHPHVLIVGDAENASVPARLPARWQLFVSLCSVIEAVCGQRLCAVLSVLPQSLYMGLSLKCVLRNSWQALHAALAVQAHAAISFSITHVVVPATGHPRSCLQGLDPHGAPVSRAHPRAQMMTLPELEGRSGYWDAQHRHLRTVRYVRERRPELLTKRFFLLIGEQQPRCPCVG